VQHATAPDDSVPLDKLGKKFIQEVTGVFLFLQEQWIQPCLPPSAPSRPNKWHPLKKNDAKMSAILELRGIAGRSHRNLPIKRHETCNPLWHVLPFGTESLQQSQQPHVHGRLRGNTHQQWGSIKYSQIIKAVMSSAADAKLGALFINAKTTMSMQQTLEEMVHPQPRTPIQTENSTAHALLTNRILPKALKAMDM
jgi:hypothetical protein